VIPFWNGDCRNSDFEVYESLYDEKFGINSRCIEGDFVKADSLPHLHSSCHEVTCLSDRAVITIGTTTVDCFFNGFSNKKEVEGFEGSVICPDSNILCADVPCFNACSGHGKCISSVCTCDDGFWGVDCSKKCDLSCLGCNGGSSSNCTSCSSGIVFTGSSCVCSNNTADNGNDDDWFVEPFKTCTSPFSCPIGSEPTNLTTKWCKCPESLAVGFNLWEYPARSYGSVGYLDYVNLSHCNPPNDMSDMRGDYFGSEHHHTLRISEIPLFKTYSIEMWIRA
jgi:hypothetical protein